MITYWMWKSVNKKHLDEIVVVTIITPLMLITDFFTFPLEIIGVIMYLVFKEVNVWKKK